MLMVCERVSAKNQPRCFVSWATIKTARSLYACADRRASPSPRYDRSCSSAVSGILLTGRIARLCAGASMRIGSLCGCHCPCRAAPRAIPGFPLPRYSLMELPLCWRNPHFSSQSNARPPNAAFASRKGSRNIPRAPRIQVLSTTGGIYGQHIRKTGIWRSSRREVR